MIGLVKFFREELAIDLFDAQEETISSFDAGNYSAATWQIGRRWGKSTLADGLVLADVYLRGHLRKQMRPGELRVSGIVCPRLEQARAHIVRIAAMVRGSRRLRSMLVSETADELTFSNNSVIRAYPCSARTIRGDAWSCAVLDELAHFLDSDGPAAGDRILEAVLPSMAQFGTAGWCIAISTPMWRSGAFHRLVERAKSGAFPGIHYRHYPTSANPLIPADWLEQRRLEDPALYSREFQAEFVDGIHSFLAAEDVYGCRRSTDKLPPVHGTQYAGALDPAFARDAFAMSVAHKDPDGRVIVDGLWRWTRKGFEFTLDAVRDVVASYRIDDLQTDQFSSQAVLEGLQRRGVTVRVNPWDNASKWEALARLKSCLTTRSVELPADDALCAELASLEARPTPSGATRIAAAGSGHDDLAIATAAVVHHLADGGGMSDYAIACLAAVCSGAPLPAAPGEYGETDGFVGRDGRARQVNWDAVPITERGRIRDVLAWERRLAADPQHPLRVDRC